MCCRNDSRLCKERGQKRARFWRTVIPKRPVCGLPICLSPPLRRIAYIAAESCTCHGAMWPHGMDSQNGFPLANQGRDAVIGRKWAWLIGCLKSNLFYKEAALQLTRKHILPKHYTHWNYVISNKWHSNDSSWIHPTAPLKCQYPVPQYCMLNAWWEL